MEQRRSSDEISQEFNSYIAGLVFVCRERDAITGLVLMGSTADRVRVDEWSDHDFAVVCESGMQETLRGDLSWLPRSTDLVLAAREHHDGFKAVYSDGAVIEFAVVDLTELGTFFANAWEVVYDDGGVLEVMSAVAAKPAPHGSEPSRDFAVFLTALLVGVGRARRGERLSASGSVRGVGVDHLTAVFAAALPASGKDRLDNLDPRRRFELVYPEVAHALECAISSELEECARGLLDLAESSLSGSWPPFPREAVETVRRRLGWTG
ncbi:MAG TPA: hypothetical protein DCP11_10690 [Microbacteriaceae bacterium]|jgi:hypothetical protein|nr:hypothetical protein [Microbacteriaceae bacterium]